MAVMTPSRRFGPAVERVRFCRAPDGVRIAYAVCGSGPPLLVGKMWISHLQYDWQDPTLSHVLEALSRIATVVRYDERGYGLSDWDPPGFTLDSRVADLEAVAGAVGFNRYAVLAMGQTGQVAIHHAVRHPGRVTRLILNGAYAGVTDEYRQRFEEFFTALTAAAQYGWTLADSRFRRVFSESMVPGATEDQKRWIDDLAPLVTSKTTAVAAARARREIDVQAELSDLAVPTLVVHSRGNRMTPFEQGRVMASGIPDARLVTLDTDNFLPLADEPAWPVWQEAVRHFLEPDRESVLVPPPDTQLTTREEELLVLVAEGLSNDQIADRLTLSARTVERHMSNVYRKLGVSGATARAAAVAHILRR